MASASSPHSSVIEESLDELTCTVCLELFEEPVALSCGHSFCHVCIEKYWESREEATPCICPNCREVFPQKPKLKKNVILANLREQMKFIKREVELRIQVQEAEPCGLTCKKGVNSGDVEHHCEVCNKKAAKRCVPCEILCCEKHVKPHQQKGHKLVKPGVKLEELRCTKHGKPLLLYCKVDESLMCVMCTAGQHKDHEVVSVEIAHDELKGVLAAKFPDVSSSKQHLMSKLQKLQQDVERTQDSGSGINNRLEGKRRDLYRFVDEAVDLMKSQVNKTIEEKLSLLEQQKEKVQKQIEFLCKAESALQRAIQELEAISFLQGFKDLRERLESVSHFRSLKVKPRTVLDCSKEEKNLDSLIELHKNFLKKLKKSVKRVDMPELKRNDLRSLYGQTLNLDPNSASPWILISQDLKMATRTKTEQPHPEHPDRFTSCNQVLSSESFSSGRHYWEVDVSSSRFCRIGICLNSIRRKGEGKECRLGRNTESWCLEKDNNKYTAMHNNRTTTLSVRGDPDRFGFFLDCDAGELRCFGDSRVLHVFRGDFTDPVKPALGIVVVDLFVGDSVEFCSL